MEADSDSDEELEEIREGFASMCLSKETKQSIWASWTNEIIVKVFGKNVGYNYLRSKLLDLWKLNGRVDMVDLGRDFFLLRFLVDEDLEAVLKKGPWFVGGHFLSIRKWEANFKPSKASISSMAVWVRLNELPLEYYEATMLRQIGQALRTILRVDTHTALEARGRYARLCIQVDMNKPLVTNVLIGQRSQPVVYERLNQLCFDCGCLGHQWEFCPFTIKLCSSAGPHDSFAANNNNRGNPKTSSPVAHLEDIPEN
nr:uncharacterized protein At4g02000-like [Quercus suber]POE72678.1 uncharacterized protein CFP56_18678 [Quercus suber]